MGGKDWLVVRVGGSAQSPAVLRLTADTEAEAAEAWRRICVDAQSPLIVFSLYGGKHFGVESSEIPRSGPRV